ncbi:uncharacterized protein LOC111328278 [Stylophora pistillata]|uniref:Transient receptor potential cation channel subfamily V member 1 n=1 Tax=Stylophora pistillata TaxID=50429 RepID=A0A2B4S8B4_STYPI|nr:uncharacterized protein LOC111328278 [Stylophora pistillata]PFX26904.1 Transient receptor potential cation channel subfamily V member 1 [Stylophora pistillata]
MIHRISAEDLILQRSASQLDDSCSIASSFTLQDRVEAIQQSSEEFHEMVKKEMREKGVDRSQAMDLVRLQRLIDVCDTKENTALYLLQDWNYEPQVCRFLRLLSSSGVNLKDVVDFLHNTPLHIAATKNFISLSKLLIDSYPCMLMAINGQGEMPVETAIRHSQDDVAAFLIRRMDHRRVRNLFKAKKERNAAISLVKLTEEFGMQKTIVALLDCLVSPRWPHPPCLPSDIVPCLSWEHLQDKPTHFHVTYDILESDVNGRFPDDPDYEYTPKSFYYNLTKHFQQNLNKEILNHVVIKLLTKRKWEKYAAFWFRVRFFNYVVFLAVLSASFMSAATSDDPLDYKSSPGRRTTEILVTLMTLWFIADEISELKREPLAYAKDVFNYLDLSGYFLIAATFVFRYLGSDAQWILGSLAIIINFCGIFKYSVGDRYIGLYIKCLGMVIYKDIPRFLVVFTIILVAFSISFFTALKAGDFNLGSALGSEYSLCKEDVGCVMLAGLKTWLEGSSVVRSLSTAGWLGAILAIFFMLSVVIILLNVLIAQLSLTYEMVQEESLLSFSVLRMQSVATIEWQSRFKYWNLRKKYYVPGEIKSREEVEEMMKQYRESTNPTSPRDDEK